MLLDDFHIKKSNLDKLGSVIMSKYKNFVVIGTNVVRVCCQFCYNDRIKPNKNEQFPFFMSL